MNRKYFSINYYKNNITKANERINKDRLVNKAFRGEMTRKIRNSYEWKYILVYRKYQANFNTIWKYYYKYKIDRITKKTGIDFEYNPHIGDGLIIGHWGRIVVNKATKFGNMIFITHGVTIGRDIRGMRIGVPTFGDRICIRANSTIVGGIKIGNDVLIAPNTFVNFDVPSHSVVIGNPATIHHKDNATEGHIPEIHW